MLYQPITESTIESRWGGPINQALIKRFEKLIKDLNEIDKRVRWKRPISNFVQWYLYKKISETNTYIAAATNKH